jgi:hypothetical protein
MISIPLDIDKYTLITINDILRMFVIQVVAQVLFSFKNDSDLFTGIFIENTLFLLLGVIVYWFVFNNLLVFTSNEDKDKSIKNLSYYQNIYSLKDKL